MKKVLLATVLLCGFIAPAYADASSVGSALMHEFGRCSDRAQHNFKLCMIGAQEPGIIAMCGAVANQEANMCLTLSNMMEAAAK